MTQGYLAFVLHAHLPFVRHPEHEHFLEEDWLYEAITETYIPLIDVFNRLVDERVPCRVTMTITPTLSAMLADPLLQQRYVRKVEGLIELADKEVHRTRWQPEFNHLALMYHYRLSHAREMFVERYRLNLLAAFRALQDAGAIEIVTCGATHGFFPLMEGDGQSPGIRAQVAMGVAEYERHFGRRPRGIWLPECGYRPGVDEVLRANGIRYFFLDTHGVLFAVPRPVYGVYAPILCPSGVAAFGRDIESSKQVWSAQEGYPGDFLYRDFYRDIGWDLEYEYVRPYLPPTGERVNLGIKYYAITGKQTVHKQPYNPAAAQERAATHAGNFMFNREQQIIFLGSFLGRKPIIVAPYDAELFGHWWYEGPDWLNFVIRKVAFDQRVMELITCSDYLEMYPTNQVAEPSMSSWGYQGYNDFWLNGSNDWIYRHLHEATRRMHELACTYPNAEGLLRRALNQAGREVLLAQSSDWAFIMKTGTMVEYAVRRTREHIHHFHRLHEQIRSGQVDEGYVQLLEDRHTLFPTLDYRMFV